jgi:epoxyqueuosine reductase QueG
MNNNLEDQIKVIAKNAGAELVGITSKDRLMNNECSDPTYYLPSAQSVVCFAVSIDKDTIRNFLKKKDVSAQKEQSLLEGKLYHKLIFIGDKVKKFLEEKGYIAVNCEVNMDYRVHKRQRQRNDIKRIGEIIELAQKDPNNPLIEFLKTGKRKFFNPDLTPYLSLRYAAVASGIGRLGWSGNLVTKEFGARVYLGGVATTAKLKSDPYLKENPCNRCKVCVSTCQGQFFDGKESQTVQIGEIEEEIGKKGNLAKCILSCGGFTGQSKYKSWSTWSPWRIDIPEDGNAAEEVLQNAFIDYILAGGAKAKNVLRLSTDTIKGFRKDFKPIESFEVTCGICQLVCWENEEERRENARLLHSSGVVELDNGKKVIRRNKR